MTVHCYGDLPIERWDTCEICDGEGYIEYEHDDVMLMLLRNDITSDDIIK